MSEIEIIKYTDSFKEKWDEFVTNKSVNGTFLQTREFLNYHGTRFIDCSILFIRGGNTIIAVCPACEKTIDGKKEFLSHIGSTFGGLIIGKEFYTISNITDIFDSFENYIQKNKYNYVLLKSTNEIFSLENNNLIDYFCYKYNYSNYDELSFAFDFSRWIASDDLLNFKSKTRNLFRSSLKNGLELKELKNKVEIEIFFNILCESLKKYDTKPVHSLDELYDLYYNRIGNNIRFYGVYQNDTMIAGSMVFIINNVFHTQYLCALPDYLYLKPMDFLDGNLIILSHNEGFKFFSFGISTENHGKYLNESLAKFKEGFGTQFYINKTFYKTFE